LAAADYLLQRGHACTVVDRHSEAGGTLRSQVDEQVLPRAVLDQEIAHLQRLGLELKLGLDFGTVVTLDGLQRGFDVVLLTLGQLGPEQGQSFGVARTAVGLKVNAQTYQTNLPNVFAAGSAVKPLSQLVRAMAEGRAAAQCIDQFLSGHSIGRTTKTFSSIMGRVEKAELELFLKEGNPEPRYDASCHGCAGLGPAQAPGEAARCLHCDCRAVGHCELQRYAELYGANPTRYREHRRPFEQHLQHGEIIYEPGKCILCGICVQLAEKAREPLGLAFIGRGFDVRVAAPFNRTIAEGLQKVAAECVEHCPTGALVFRDGRERQTTSW
jgi:ferredoxin